MTFNLSSLLKRIGLNLILSLAALLSVISQASAQETGSRTDGAQEQLVSRLASGDEEQRMDAAVRLGALFASAPGSITLSTINALAVALQRDLSPIIRALAANALEKSADDRAVQPLLAALGKEKEVAVVKAIIYALARYPSAQITTALIPLLNDKKQELRAAAAYSLAESGDASTANALIEFLQKRRKDEDAFARSQAARGLGRIGGRAALDPLLDALTRDKSDNVRREAACALGRIASKQDAKVIKALRAATLADDPYLTAAADAALAEINSRTS